jgi:hypothetical protein
MDRSFLDNMLSGNMPWDEFSSNGLGNPGPTPAAPGDDPSTTSIVALADSSAPQQAAARDLRRPGPSPSFQSLPWRPKLRRLKAGPPS